VSDSRRKLLQRMKENVAKFAESPAVIEPSGTTTYRMLSQTVGTLRRMLRAKDAAGHSPIGLLLDRSSLAYASMWAAIGESRAYVPLNRQYPASRLMTIIKAAGIEQVICDENSAKQAESLGLGPHQILLWPENAGNAEAMDLDADWSAGADRDALAYILFTSGSTGAPKGVPISYDNLLTFIDGMMATIPYPEGSICSQVCELSFDVSVHEIFAALFSGAALCPVRQIDLFNPGQFIEKNAISVWISVPSLARVILKNQDRAPHSLDSIKLSIFNGEPLMASTAKGWQAATPKAALWNTYGPTECTVAVTTQPWTDRDDLSEIDVVTIGSPLPQCRIAVLNEDGVIIPLEEGRQEDVGELLLQTPQRFLGYLDPELTKPFVFSGGEIYYKTGDKALLRDGRIFHLGRLDHQVKIGGHRIELMEVEHQLRNCLRLKTLAVVAHPKVQPNELVVFIEGEGDPPRLSSDTVELPKYMIPKRTIMLEKFPSTTHGKLDRLALSSMLEGE